MKSYTDLEQSKKLTEFLPIESADMYYVLSEDESTNMISFGKSQGFFDKTQVAWSLAALLSVVSEEVSLNSFKDGNWNAMVQQNGKMIYSDANNPIDACVAIIEKLHEQNLL